MAAPGPMAVRVERGGESLELTAPYALPALVEGVEPLSPASAAGLKRGDLILEADGKPLASFEALRAVVLASGGRTHPAPRLARRRAGCSSRSARRSATPRTAPAASSGG